MKIEFLTCNHDYFHYYYLHIGLSEVDMVSFGPGHLCHGPVPFSVPCEEEFSSTSLLCLSAKIYMYIKWDVLVWHIFFFSRWDTVSHPARWCLWADWQDSTGTSATRFLHFTFSYLVIHCFQMLLANRQVALLLQAPYAVVLPCRAPTDTCCAKIGVTKTCSTTCGQTTSHSQQRFRYALQGHNTQKTRHNGQLP